MQLLRSPFIFILTISLFLSSCLSEQQKLKQEIESIEYDLKNKVFMRTPDSLFEAVINMRNSYMVIYPTDTAVVLPFMQRNIQDAFAIENYDLAEQALVQYIDSFPEAKDTPIKRFILGFEVYEKGMKRNEKAEEVYLSFIHDYPDHPLLTDVLAALEFLGKSDEEVLEMLN